MPKQIYKIDRFEGGLNTNADPRDIADNELSFAYDIMVDELGQIRTMGGDTAHPSETGAGSTAHTNEITPGYGLFAWKADRTAAQLRISDYTGTHTAADSSTVMTDSAASFPVDALIGATINNTTDGSSGVITDNTATTVTVASLSGGSDNSWDDAANDAYTITDIPTTGESYLAFSDSDATGTVMIYGEGSDSWDTPIIGMTNQTGGTRKDVFYAVDGNLRICDAEFKNTNTTQWHGYVDRVFMQAEAGNEVTVDYWTTQSQNIEKPGPNSGWDDDISTASTTSTGHTHTSTSTGIGTALGSDATGTVKYFELENVLNDGAGDAVSNIYTMEITVRVDYDGSSDRAVWAYDLTAGDATDTNTFAGTLGQHHKSTTYVGDGSIPSSSVIEDRVHTFTFAISDTPLGTSGGGPGVRAVLDVDFVQDTNSIDIHQVVVTEGSSTGNAHDGVGGADITTNEVFVEAKFESTTNAIGWDRKWEHGFTFIYDGNQESLVRRIEKVDPSSGATSPPTYLQDNTANASHAPSVRINVPYDSAWNPRITGGVWYIRDVSGDVPSKWWAQAECDFVKGSIKVLQSGVEYDVALNPTTSEWNFDIDHENLLQPNQVDTYRSRNGFSEDNESITAKYKTAVQVGRQMYIGNVQILKEDGTKEVKGDAMLKSPVNRFDTFPSKSIVEAAINDGESITALEEFADRILQFKESTLYIINVSQGIEFLEDTYKYKGVKQPSAVCKTDYGIAWVNHIGCYLYDGKQVINLLEKGGRQIIKDVGDDSWAGSHPSSENPMIGYLPQKRQLIVVDDNTTTGGGHIYLYDMVTQSWSFGVSKITSQALTNFVNDSNGDLTWSHTSDTGTMRMWSDTSVASSNFHIRTKDIDFGEPGRKKKLYKVLISYKGDGSAVTVRYGVDGETDDYTPDTYQFNSSNTPLADKSSTANMESWTTAELKPTTSSEANGIYSLRLWFRGTAGATFRINDISCVYRAKPVR